MQSFLASLLLTLTVFANPSAVGMGQPETTPKPEAAPATSVATDVAGQYIVVFKDEVADPDTVGAEMAATHGLGIEHSYRHTIKGFAGTVPEGRLEALKHDPRVAFVSEDGVVNTFAKPSSVVSQPAQKIPTGISRIGSSTLTGNGVTVAVVDTGIDLTHPDLAGSIVASTNCVSTRKSANDDNGHGTHVAGTIAAANNGIGAVGVAPGAKLVAVKVLNAQGSGTWSSIICGLDWVTANAGTYNIEVANMSLGGTGSSDDNCGLTNNDALHQAICRSRDAGITFIVAAGNSSVNAATAVPAAYNDAVITVSALTDTDGLQDGAGSPTSYGADDTFASFSNYGNVVDIAAPGVNIFSTWKSSSYSTISGTSMATPHVAGAAALFLEKYPNATWTQIREGLKAAGEVLGAGHTDTTGRFPEAVLQVNAL